VGISTNRDSRRQCWRCNWVDGRRRSDRNWNNWDGWHGRRHNRNRDHHRYDRIHWRNRHIADGLRSWYFDGHRNWDNRHHHHQSEYWNTGRWNNGRHRHWNSWYYGVQPYRNYRYDGNCGIDNDGQYR
jgi:hypothetical protein